MMLADGKGTGEIHTKLAVTVEELSAVFAIRLRVFVEEQGISTEDDLDGSDASAVHALAIIDDRPVGTGRFIVGPDAEAEIGRMAVDLEWRCRGIGSRLLRFLEQEARLREINHVVLNAQCYIKSFYSAKGYIGEGEVFLDAGIKHVRMSKTL